ncbi:hypothetical protein NQ317_014839 [Molorchus minor]|uniref:NFX1-type zinc finger-containing protein 1 n=1 Tax=Molorchus minor TaxID=1323400 RepID=A0ABQ9JSX6_9CUCU|nr:hypothetical protein NQ317_014839 [Molorchus minor]
MQEREKINEQYKEKHRLYSDQRNIEEVKIMKENLVIGMTTTGAARLRTSLEALRSPVVIVEEAAEVLEAHIVTALTVHCQHLILIGDHKQLKPSTADYTIETKYLMGISLFERMVNNNLQCHQLNVQHRMKPNICNLIRPVIYPDLIDHISVSDRPSIRGIEKDIFFIHHTHPKTYVTIRVKRTCMKPPFL